ncbi:peptide ABC transporter substrate-binding protein [Candidatus Kaiserbacteria bacterium]|nr:peptide ABC transporter substrate-binding protein [Candidatus Kaiserbacteria bacterium]
MDEPSRPRRSLLTRFFSVMEGNSISDRFGLRALFFIVIATILFLLIVVSGLFSHEQGKTGGTFTEGMLGTPRFVTPALALTRTDQDLTELLYSGLMRIGTDGTLAYDLAERIDISDDGRTYTVTLKSDRTFHDGTPITASDVLYTIRLIQDPNLKSPLRGNWSSVTVEALDDLTVVFTLEEAYAPFIENFTVGIMPAHVWRDLSVEQIPFSPANTNPVGSGPYQVSDVMRDKNGIITRYDLVPHDRGDQTALIQHITVDFFNNELELRDALVNHKIDATAHLSVESLVTLETTDWNIINEPLPRIFGVFFNQNKSTVLRDESVREALGLAVDRQHLINTALGSYGVPSNGPIALSDAAVKSEDTTTTPAAILTADDWTQTDTGQWEKEIGDDAVPLSFTLKTSNNPLFARVSEGLQASWQAAGVAVAVEQYEQADLVQAVIRPRDFEALLFGLDMNRSHDLYPFWHSSQQNDPGLNIAQYANITVDNLLERARTEQNQATRESTLLSAGDIIKSEHPAVFLFQPSLVYVINPDVTLTPIVSPGTIADRFANVDAWYIESESLWSFFK